MSQIGIRRSRRVYRHALTFRAECPRRQAREPMASAGISRPIPIGSPAAIQALRADWAATASVRFDVYAPPDAVRFAKRPCRPADTQSKFICTPCLSVRATCLAASARWASRTRISPSPTGTASLFEDRCWVRVPLPSYPLARPFDSARQRLLWQATLPLRSPDN